MKVWTCFAVGEAWDLELHEKSPCDWSRMNLGDSPGEHDRCGPMRLIPDNAETVVTVEKAILDNHHKSIHNLAIAVLDALDGETP